MTVDLAKFAQENGVKYFMISFTDLFGGQRAKLVPARAIADMQEDGAGFAGFATWLDLTPAHPDMLAVPDPDAEGMKVVEWELEPGDAVAFNYNILHGARGNEATTRRRAFSLRLLGDDARYVERPGPTSPPFPGHDMTPGQKLRSDWFPTLFER